MDVFKCPRCYALVGVAGNAVPARLTHTLDECIQFMSTQIIELRHQVQGLVAKLANASDLKSDD